MDQFTTIFEQTRQFAAQHAPASALRETIPIAIIFLVAGIGLSVLGAKLARIGMTFGWLMLGALGGGWIARQTGFPAVVCVTAGAITVGIIGHQTYRLWVGLAAAVVISAATLGAFGYQNVMPHVSEFGQRVTLASSASAEQFVIPTPEQQEAYAQRTPRQWFQQFWGYVAQQEPGIVQKGRALGLATFIAGLCIGLLAARLALILSTSLIGTALVTTGMFTLIAHFMHDRAYQALENHPTLVGLTVGVFLVSSIILQTLLTRRHHSPKMAEKPA
jgi:hypothetical protein